jgi:hypothetical protein
MRMVVTYQIKGAVQVVETILHESNKRSLLLRTVVKMRLALYPSKLSSSSALMAVYGLGLQVKD